VYTYTDKLHAHGALRRLLLLPPAVVRLREQQVRSVDRAATAILGLERGLTSASTHLAPL
jgi:hypothetical protein